VAFGLVGCGSFRGHVLLRLQRRCLDLVGELLGHAAVPGVDFGFDLGELSEQVGDALGPHRSLVVHAPGAERARPQGTALLVGDDGGLLRVLLFLARYERAASGLARARASHLHFRPVEAQFDAMGRGVGEHVGQGAQPHVGLAGHGEPAGREQRPDLPDRAGDRGTVDAIQDGQCRMGKLEPQVNEGDDDPIDKRQVMVRTGAGRAHPLVAPALAQPGLLRCRPRTRQILDELAQPPRLDPGKDTLAQGRAGPS
jgi:hypothetical protein